MNGIIIFTAFYKTKKNNTSYLLSLLQFNLKIKINSWQGITGSTKDPDKDWELKNLEKY